MSFERTAAFDEFLFSITIPTSWAKIIDLLSTEDLQILENYKFGNYYLIVDGYIVSYADNFEVRIKGGSGTESVTMGQKYFDPTVNWIEKVEVRAIDNIVGSVRLFSSKNVDILKI